MRTIDLTKIKIKLNIIIWVIIVFILFLLNQASNNFQLKSDISKIRKKQKKEIQNNIENREKVIERLKAENKTYKTEVKDLIIKIDSLQRIKTKIQIKYVDRISNIKVMDSEQIKKYWDEEFN
jgi:uncharacterized protein YlxW (UPF0749 family)